MTAVSRLSLKQPLELTPGTTRFPELLTFETDPVPTYHALPERSVLTAATKAFPAEAQKFHAGVMTVPALFSSMKQLLVDPEPIPHTLPSGSMDI